MALETVLLAVGGKSDDQIDRMAALAADIAGPADATIVLGHVFTEEDYDDALERLEFDDDTDVTPDTVAGRNVAVRRLRERFEEHDIDVEHTGTIGQRAEGVIDLAKETDAHMLAVGGRRRSPTGKAVFGSTAQEILLDAPCPVTFIKSESA
ncbi:universal stress protein [Halobacteriales archaeon SW_8_65_20]|nr:MAG: universal stress protein [Halobacteriales archaeon SW_8_65_20]